MIYKVGALIVAGMIWFGLIGPWMISADSDYPVIGWILVTIAGFLYAFNKIIRSFK